VLKILHYVHDALPLQTGYTIRTHNIASNLTKLGYRIFVANQIDNDTNAYKKIGLSTQSYDVIDGVKYLTSPPNKRRFLRSLLWKLDRDGIPQIFNLARKINLLPSYLTWLKQEVGTPDIIHAHSPPKMAEESHHLSSILNVPMIYEVRGFWGLSVASNNGGSADVSKELIPDLRACKRAGQVVAICNGVADQLIRGGIQAKKITIIPNGVDTNNFNRSCKDNKLANRLGVADRFVYGYVSNVRRLEGIQTVIKAWHEIKKRIPEAVIVLVGDGLYLKNLEMLVKTEGLEESIRFVGRVPHDEIVNYYSLFDAFVVPRIPEPVCQLVTPLKPLEAMSIGIPVIASDVVALREFITDGETGLLFKSANSTALADACIKMARDDGLRKEISQNARKWVIKNRDWSVVASKYKGVYQQIQK
jgi:glycosyltransferase involved in cell wall biosynthesis